MNNIKAIRQRLGMTQADFAEAVGVTQGNIGHYECQRQEVSPGVARRLIEFAATSGVTVSFNDIYSEPDSSSVEHAQKAAVQSESNREVA